MKKLLLSNTLSGKVEHFVPKEKEQVRMYVCGITPYDYAHVGHGRCYVTFDVLYRLLNFLGYKVTYCRNFTDIDDKLIKRACERYQDPARYKEVADFYIAAYTEDMNALACLKPTYEPCVTEHINEIIAFVDGLIAEGKAYAVGGDVYFRISSFPEYGKLSKRNIQDMIAGARVAPNEKKENPLDFALWKGESEGTFWKSPWGYGRPGWHIECSTLARHYLGETLDIHGGGMDLIFPHHENEVAQSESLNHAIFSRYWMHNAFVRINQEKMSKSLGNFFTLRDLFAQFDPMVVRYSFLQHQYRNPLDFSYEELESVRKSYQRLCKAFAGAKNLDKLTEENLSPIGQRMIQFLCEDLNTPGMLGVVFENVKEITQDDNLKAEIRTILNELGGLALEPIEEEQVAITPEIQALLDAREEARARKDWAESDRLRDKLRELGVEIQDKKAKS